MAIPPRIRVNVAAPFPAMVTGQNGVSLGKQNGIWTVGLNTPSLQTGFPTSANFANDYVIVYDATANLYTKVSLGTITGIGGGMVVIAPTTGFSFAITSAYLILDPAGMLATGTFTLPPLPVDGQSVNILSTQPISSLTVTPNAGQHIKSAPTTLPAGQWLVGIFVLGTATWYFGL